MRGRVCLLAETFGDGIHYFNTVNIRDLHWANACKALHAFHYIRWWVNRAIIHCGEFIVELRKSTINHWYNNDNIQRVWKTFDVINLNASACLNWVAIHETLEFNTLRICVHTFRFIDSIIFVKQTWSLLNLYLHKPQSGYNSFSIASWNRCRTRTPD